MMRYLVYINLLSLLFWGGCKNPSRAVDPLPSDPEPLGPETGLVVHAPDFPDATGELTIRFDPRKGDRGMENHSGDVYAHIGVITSASSGSTDWKYTKTEWQENTAANRMTRTEGGFYELKIKPREFFGVPASETITHIAMVFRNADGTRTGRNADGSDIFIRIYAADGLHVRFAAPEMQPMFAPALAKAAWSAGETMTLTGLASKEASLSVSVNGETIGSVSANGVSLSYTLNNHGDYTFTLKAAAGGAVSEASFSLFVSGESQVAELPAGASPNGVTFGNNGTTAIFVLTAPDKEASYLIGDFNDWRMTSVGHMKRTPDGKRWWAQVDNLDPDRDYAYQFVVDGSLRIADPYAELVLDPDHDRYIPTSTFPGLPAYPAGKTTGIVSVARANQPDYSWSSTALDRPHKHDLVIYELLLRDFLDANNYQTLVDTLDYLSNLGVNAVGLLPVNEFEGNSSWGYNPSFYFAPDKYYGTKNALKHFIDACHQRGIAVIMDMVLNHSFGQSPMVQLYMAGGKPAANSPWFNPDARHPFNVGYDFNHESEYTKAFAKDVIRFWMEEYRVDGFRFDLSKGFTQKNSGTAESGVGIWSQYDASRVAIWKDYNRFIQTIDPGFYVILEHFAVDEEERELAQEGMMLWNNLNHAFNEATMGWLDNADLGRLLPANRGFAEPNLVSYMESHDEERIMFKNLQYGNAKGDYNIKELNTALKRVEMAAAFLFAAPGPKMLWQFGELGYDVSIDENGRTGEKPILWSYNTGNRRALYHAYSRFIGYKTSNTIFREGEATANLAGAVKHIRLVHGGQEVWVVGNFDVETRSANLAGFAEGTWHDNVAGQPVQLTAGYGQALAPGEYHIFSKIALTR